MRVAVGGRRNAISCCWRSQLLVAAKARLSAHLTPWLRAGCVLFSMADWLALFMTVFWLDVFCCDTHHMIAPQCQTIRLKCITLLK